jgi:adenylyl cyclase-associated protein
MAAPVYMEVLKDLQKEMTAVDNIRQNNRASEYRDHLEMVADGVGALVWITFDTKPGDAVAELFGGAQMYGNKILRQYKDKCVGIVPLYSQAMSLTIWIETRHTSNGSAPSTKS